MRKNLEANLATTKEFLQKKSTKALASFLSQLHPADIAEILEELTEAEKPRVLSLLDSDLAAPVIEELDYDDQSGILRQLGQQQATAILDEMADDNIADLLGEVPPQEAHEILQAMEKDEAQDVQSLLKYDEDTAGGLMTTDYVALSAEITAEAAISTLRQLAPDAETIYYVYVIDANGILVGVLSLRDLIVAPPSTFLRNIMHRQVISVAADMDQEEVARIVSKYDFLALPVVSKEGHLLGIITVDDVIDVIEEEASEDIYRLAATSPEEKDFVLSSWERAKKRLPWLVGLLFGELLAGNVIKNFSGIIEVFTVLAFFIPVMTGEAGNAATQSLAVVVRGLATGEIELEEIWQVVWKEAKVGLLVGAVTGIVLAFVSYLWEGSPVLGLLTGVALVLNIFAAAILGGFFPVVIKRMGIDPAVASGPFITTLTDVISMFIYFSLATFFVSRLTM
ncbi:MAG: magnesium transporter [Firmicutes bacterium]|nr:magnesium transporter [Bacillota bacterium]